MKGLGGINVNSGQNMQWLLGALTVVLLEAAASVIVVVAEVEDLIVTVLNPPPTMPHNTLLSPAINVVKRGILPPAVPRVLVVQPRLAVVVHQQGSLDNAHALLLQLEGML
jgi:hypothetical protein